MTNWDGADASLFDPSMLRRLLEQLESTDIDEFEFVHGSSRLYIRRDFTKRLFSEYTDGSRTRGGEQAGHPIAAPLTGVYYARSSPEDPPYVADGSHIEPGQVVALIETMKLFNEVTSEVTGEVLSVAVKDGDLVELGQPLMYVRLQEEDG
ncbi:MAG: hypothetical protein NVSMB52_12220 [Chloroflexota bacterium]